MSNEMMHHGIDLIAEQSPVDARSEKKFACTSQQVCIICTMFNELHRGTDLIAERSPVDERSEKKFACMSQCVCFICILSNEISIME